MPKVVKKAKKVEMEIKSVWVNGEFVTGTIKKVIPPAAQKPYWQIWSDDGSFLTVTGQVVVKEGPKGPKTEPIRPEMFNINLEGYR